MRSSGSRVCVQSHEEERAQEDDAQANDPTGSPSSRNRMAEQARVNDQCDHQDEIHRTDRRSNGSERTWSTALASASWLGTGANSASVRKEHTTGNAHGQKLPAIGHSVRVSARGQPQTNLRREQRAKDACPNEQQVLTGQRSLKVMASVLHGSRKRVPSRVSTSISTSGTIS